MDQGSSSGQRFPPCTRVQNGRPIRGPMPRAAGRVQAAGAVGAAEWGRGQPVGVGRDHGLWAMVVATELTMLEGGGPTETGACCGPQASTHLRVAQASGMAEMGVGEGVKGSAGGPSQRRNRDPKRWPVSHRAGPDGGSERSRKQSRTVPEVGDRNAELCTGCGKGGHLYCCGAWLPLSVA